MEQCSVKPLTELEFMNNQKAKRILSDLKKLKTITDKLIVDFEDLIHSEESDTLRQKRNKVNIPSDEELRKEWKRLQEEKHRGQDVNIVLDKLFHDKTKSYMTAFIRANSLPIQSKESKNKILQQLQSLLNVGTTITGR